MSDTTTSGSSNGEGTHVGSKQDLSRQRVARVIRYEKPATTRDRHIVSFGRTDSMMVFMQVLLRAGESRLHAHPNTDSFWWVVRGRAEFYTTDHELLAELESENGLLIPRDYPYYFNAVGEDHLEILQMESFLRQGERLQTVHLEDERVGEYEVTQAGEDVAAGPARVTRGTES
jgi:mannose-6-phosphate isomerase-like protein (cupin superfamily)